MNDNVWMIHMPCSHKSITLLKLKKVHKQVRHWLNIFLKNYPPGSDIVEITESDIAESADLCDTRPDRRIDLLFIRALLELHNCI